MILKFIEEQIVLYLFVQNRQRMVLEVVDDALLRISLEPQILLAYRLLIFSICVVSNAVNTKRFIKNWN